MKYLFTEEELLSLLKDVINIETNKKETWLSELSVKEISEKLGYKIIKN